MLFIYIPLVFIRTFHLCVKNLSTMNNELEVVK